jgi:LemA protein
MSVFVIVMLAIIVVASVYGVTIYNNLVALKHNVSKAWANIDVLLKQRHDELPKLVETCKRYMTFEKETLARVMEARAKVFAAREAHDIKSLGLAEGKLRAGIGNLFALAEAYPELKTSETFLQLQARITALENAIADRREFYNESVNVNNVRIEQFPDNIIASMFLFRSFKLLEFDANERADVNIKEAFS